MLSEIVKIFSNGNAKDLNKEMNAYIQKMNKEGYEIKLLTQDMYKTGDYNRYILCTVVFKKQRQ